MHTPIRFCLLFSLLATSSLQSALLVEETFSGDYQEGSIAGQTISGATGLSGSIGSSGVSGIYTDANLHFATLQNAGGSLRITHSSTQSTVHTFTLSLEGAFTGTLYGAYLVRFNIPSQGTSFVETRINSSAGGSGTTARFRSQADGDQSDDLGAVGYASARSSASGSSLPAETTFLVLSRFTHVGQPLDSTESGQADLWILSEDQFLFFKEHGLSDAALDAATVGSDPFQVYQKASSAALQSGTYSFADGNFLQLVINTQKAPAYDVSIDALRYGGSWDAVTPIPEPGAIALLAVLAGGASLLKRHQRR